MVTGRVRTWLNLPPGAMAPFLPLPRKLLGLDLIPSSMLAELSQIGTDLTLLPLSGPQYGQTPKIKASDPPSLLQHLVKQYLEKSYGNCS